MSRQRSYQEILWKMRCPHCDCAPGKLLQISRVRKAIYGERSVEVLCDGCKRHLRIRFKSEYA